MKCWPGCASSASTTMWYIVTRARQRDRATVSDRSAPVISSSSANVFRKPHVSSGSVARSPPRDRPVAAPDDLVHEALEEDRVARLVDLLGGEEVLLLLPRGGVDERREVVGDRVLAVEEHRVVPQRGAALVLGHAPRATGGGPRSGRSRARASCRAPSARRDPRTRPARRRTALTKLDAARLCGSSSAMPATGIRSCVSESRSRSVTVPSSSVWWSTVTAYGVPISSWRR